MPILIIDDEPLFSSIDPGRPTFIIMQIQIAPLIPDHQSNFVSARAIPENGIHVMKFISATHIYVRSDAGMVVIGG